MGAFSRAFAFHAFYVSATAGTVTASDDAVTDVTTGDAAVTAITAADDAVTDVTVSDAAAE